MSANVIEVTRPEPVECAGCAEHIAARGSAVVAHALTADGLVVEERVAVLTRAEVFWAVDQDPGQDVIPVRLIARQAPGEAPIVRQLPGAAVLRCRVHEVATGLLGQL